MEEIWIRALQLLPGDIIVGYGQDPILLDQHDEVLKYNNIYRHNLPNIRIFDMNEDYEMSFRLYPNEWVLIEV